MLDLLLLLWKAGGGLKCGSMFHLDEWVVPPFPPKKNWFLFSCCKQSYNTITESIQPPVLTLHWWGWWQIDDLLLVGWRRRCCDVRERAKRPGVLHFDVCAYLYLILVYLIRQSGRESSDANVTLRFPPFSFTRSYWLFWEREKGLTYLFPIQRSRENTQHSLSIDFFVVVGVIVNFRKKRKIPK